MIKDYESFVILLCETDLEEEKIIDTVEKISLRKHIGYARVKTNGKEKYSYILFNPDKQYVFDICRNKHINIVWKDKEFFGIISFKNNPKGDIICYLKSENNNGEKFEGEIIYLNLKPEYKGRKIMLISKIVLDEKNPYKYEHFVFYKKDLKNSK